MEEKRMTQKKSEVIKKKKNMPNEATLKNQQVCSII